MKLNNGGKIVLCLAGLSLVAATMGCSETPEVKARFRPFWRTTR